MTIEQDMQAIHCYHIRMSVKVPVPQSIARTGGAAFSWLLGGWRIMLFGVIVLSLTFSPTTYKREHRYAIAHQLVLGTTTNLIWFSLLSSLISVILIRIVMVTALSYGLSKYALDMVVRMLVLELIPLSAALFVALRRTLPDSVELAEMRRRGELLAMRQQGIDLSLIHI